MKSLILVLVVGICAFIGLSSMELTPKSTRSIGNIADTTKPTPQKRYTVSLTQIEWDMILGWFNSVSFNLKKSDLPSKDVHFMVDSMIVKFQQEVIKQVRPQLPKEDKKN